MEYKRVTLLCGHYGSGKTNIAVNMALDAKKQYDRVCIADLDIVNPYFRTKDSEEDFVHSGVRLISSSYANSNVDLPAMPQEIYSILDDKDSHFIIDVGGDDRGAYALGRLAPGILAEDDYDMYMVINMYRPLTRTPEDVLEIKQEIEQAARISFTGIINNSNLGRDTDAETVLASQEYAKACCELTGLPLCATSSEASVCEAIGDRIGDLFPMKLQKRPV